MGVLCKLPRRKSRSSSCSLPSNSATQSIGINTCLQSSRFYKLLPRQAWDSDDAADYLPAAPQREFLRPELDKTALMIRFRSNEGVKTQEVISSEPRGVGAVAGCSKS